VTWYLCFGSVRDQRDVLLYEVLPFLVEMDAEGGDILWCPCPDDVEGVDYRQDAMEVLDAYEKLEEFNCLYGTKFRLGLAKMWLPVGEKFEREQVYHCRLGAALDMIGFYYVQCRVLDLGVFTTTDDSRKGGAVLDVECHSKLMFLEEEYLDSSGYKLRDYCLRTIRQRIRKLLGEEGVEPKDWSESKAAGLIRAPGDRRPSGFKFFEAPRGAPFKDLIRERASIRMEFARTKTSRKDLPQLGPIKFGMFNYMSKNVKPHDMSRTARTLLGNGVKESILLPNYVSFPSEAMLRFAQERGLRKHLNLVKVLKPVVMCQGVMRQALAPQGSPRQDVAKPQMEEKKIAAEPTSLVGAIKALNKINDGRTGAQQRLRTREVPALDRSDSSVEFIGEVKRDLERERGEKLVVRPTPREVNTIAKSPVATVAADVVDVLEEDGDSDDPDRDRIIMQRLKVKLETERLARYEAEYVLKRENRRRKR